MRERFEPCRRRALWASRAQCEERRHEEEGEGKAEAVLTAPRRYTCKVCGEEFDSALGIARHSKRHK